MRQNFLQSLPVKVVLGTSRSAADLLRQHTSKSQKTSPNDLWKFGEEQLGDRRDFGASMARSIIVNFFE